MNFQKWELFSGSPGRSTYPHILQLPLSPFQAFTSFLNLNTFSALFIVSGMAFQRMPPRHCSEWLGMSVKDLNYYFYHIEINISVVKKIRAHRSIVFPQDGKFVLLH